MKDNLSSPTGRSAETVRSEINRANAEHSTGPKTDEGKKHSSLNALRHGLTGQLMILPAEELAAYKRHCEVFRNKHQPADEYEERLVQILADTSWRLMRVPVIEANILTLGSNQYQGREKGDLRSNLATAAEFRNQSKALANITLYEQRLTRQFERTLRQLRELQAERRKPAEKQQVAAAGAGANGFVFSTDDVEPRIPAASAVETQNQRASAPISG